MLNVVSHGVVAALGIAVGIIYQVYIAQPKNNLESGASLVQESTATAKPDTQQSSVLVESKDKQRIPESKDTLTSTAIDNRNVNASKPEPVQTVGTLALLRGANIDMLDTDEFDLVAANFDAWMENSENPGKDIIDFLTSNNNDEEKHVLEYLVAKAGAMGSYDGLAESFVEQLQFASDSNYEQWENILLLVNIDTAQARTALFDTLPNISNDAVVSASLMAVQPKLIPPTDRTQFLSDLSVYADSGSEEVRSAAIMSLGQWSAHDYTYVVEGSLANGSEQERRAALFAINGGRIWSDDIQYQAMTMMNDESIPLDMRTDAFNALSYHSLNEADYAEFYNFYEEHILPLQNSTVQQ